VSIESQEAIPGDSVDVPIEISGFGDIGAISLTLTYDPEVLSFPEDAGAGELISDAPRSSFTASVPEPGEIRVSWFDGTDPILGEDRTLLRLAFSAYEGGKSAIAFSAESEISDLQASSYGASYRDGEVKSAVGQINVSVQRQFGNADDPSNYELVALPGLSDVAFDETVTGQQSTNWRGFRETGAPGGGGNTNLQECTAGGSCTFGPGRGFWVISQNDWSFDGTVPAVAGGEASSIPLQDGWNAVSNPLQTDLSWSSVQAASGLQEALWQWDGGWEEAQTFASATEGEAYYVFNGTGVDALELPSGATSARTEDTGTRTGPSATRAARLSSLSHPQLLPRVQPSHERPLHPAKKNPRLAGERSTDERSALSASHAPSAQNVSKEDFSRGDCRQPRALTLHVSVEGEETSSVTVGTSTDLQERETYRAPPGYFSAAVLHVMGKSEGTAFARQIVPATDSSHVFHLRLRGKGGTTARLAAEGLSAWRQGAVTLINQRNGSTHDLHDWSGTQISIPAGESPEVPLRLRVKSSCLPHQPESDPGLKTTSVRR
jgi:Cohesin domain.